MNNISNTFLVCLAFTLLLSVFGVSAQNIKSSDAKKIKEKKLIVAYSKYPKKATDLDREFVDHSNQVLKETIESYWDFSAIGEAMTLDEAQEVIKKDKSQYYITLEALVTKDIIDSRIISYSERLAIYSPKLSASVFLPTYEGKMTKATATFAVLQLNKLLTLLETGEIKSVLASWNYIKTNGPKIITKTLLIPDTYIANKFTNEDVKLYYPYDLEIAPIEKIEAAILSRDPKYAVAYHVTMPGGGPKALAHRVFIVNAEDGDVYGVLDNFTIDIGTIATIGGKGSHLIDENELKRLAKIVD